MALWIVPREEAELVEKLSDEYRNYQQRTGRFIPRLRTPS
jgi:protein-S-isoprenylcysteine O-methyltransferase Ste14